MRYFSTTVATHMSPLNWKVKLLYVALWFIPRSNPDFEKRFPEVDFWYVEVDDEGIPSREVGFNNGGDPIVAAPWGNNFGFWTDSGEALPSKGSKEITAAMFNAAWSNFEAQQSNLAAKDD